MLKTTACPICAAEVTNEVGRRGRTRIYCSEACNNQACRNRKSAIKQAERRASAKPCEQCAGPVPVGATGRIARYCSNLCRGVAAGNLLPEPYADRMCRLDGCGAIFVPVHVNQKCCCEQHGKRFWKQTHPRKPDPMTEKRRANLRRKTQQRRARLKGDATAELIDRDQIGERDGWCCGLCSQPVDKSLAYPHPQSASLDHVKPLSLGGKHVEANVQISHLTCNVAKGNRVADVQPLLVG